MSDENVATDEQVDIETQSEKDEKLAKLKEAIQVSIEEIGTLRRKLSITVPAEVINEHRSDEFGELKRDAVVPGFRKGHAPMKLVEKRFGSDVNEQLSSRILSNSYMAAVEKEDLKTIGDPMVWASDPKAESGERLVPVERAFDWMSLPNEGDFTYACEIELRPQFDLPELEGIAVTQPNLETSDEDVEEAVERFRAIRGQYEPMSSGKIQADDLVVCNYKATQGDKVVYEEENCQLAARPMRYAGILMDDLGKTLSGAANGDSKTLKGQLPEDYEDEALRGQTVDVTLDIQDIKRLVLPELDATFLGAMGFDSADELKTWVRGNLEVRKAEKVSEMKRDQIRQHLLQATKMELPEGLSQRQTDHIVSRRMLELARQGVPEAEIAKHVDEIRTGATSDAVNDLKLFFVFEKIAEDWDVSVSEEELNTQIATIAREQNRRFDRVRDDLMRNNSLTSLYVQIRDEKILDRMIEKAKVSDAPPPKAEKKKTTKKAATKKPAAEKPASETTQKAAGKKTAKKTTKKTDK